ncbi:MAG TPA: clostripain-related cysteine peptidase [Armatimonadota bacterium]|nr:clostripain-related cysteine peptidase [Armatimonadota bacterium]
MPMPRAFAVLVPLALVLLFAGCGGGGPALVGVGTVQGYVYAANGAIQTLTRADGTPVANADVRVQGTNLSTRTDQHGFFQLTNVPAGPRTLLISAPGFQAVAAAVTVNANAVVDIASSTLTPVTRKWTVLVYLNADNDLEYYGVQDVNEMEAVPDSEQVTVVVQMDRAPGWDTTNGNWTDTRRFVIRHDQDSAVMTSALEANALELMGEVDMGDPAQLAAFIAWGKANFPAEHYLLVVWNHGSGWRSRALADDAPATRGVSFDDTSGSYIRTTELPAALATTPQLDLVAFDASLMQMMEIAYEMRHSCRYIIGSEESPPGAGYKYDSWLGPLVADPAMTPRDLAITMARETLNYYGSGSNITHSVLDTAELDTLAAHVDAFAQALLAHGFTPTLADVRDQSEDYAYGDYKDLYDYARRASAAVSNQAVKNAASGLQAQIEKAVVANYRGALHPNSHGVSIFVPYPEVYSRLAGTYAPLALSRDTHWDEWIASQTQ